MPPVAEPRIAVIEGEKVLVFDAPSVLPASLGGLLTQLRVTFRDDWTPGGMSTLCMLRDHRLRKFREGRYLGSDGLVRDLRLFMCQDCETVCVRDVSIDSLEQAVGTPRRRSVLEPRRRNEIIGWYSGARRNQRIYR